MKLSQRIIDMVNKFKGDRIRQEVAVEMLLDGSLDAPVVPVVPTAPTAPTQPPAPAQEKRTRRKYTLRATKAQKKDIQKAILVGFLAAHSWTGRSALTVSAIANSVVWPGPAAQGSRSMKLFHTRAAMKELVQRKMAIEGTRAGGKRLYYTPTAKALKQK